MLLDSAQQYLGDVGGAVRKLEGAYVERYEEEILAFNRINLRIRVRFKTGHLFELNEAAIVKNDQFKRLNYRYHFQGSQNNLIFRYDKTPHFPKNSCVAISLSLAVHALPVFTITSTSKVTAPAAGK